MMHEWRKKSKLHEKLWAMGLRESEADAISECGNHPLEIAVAEWAMRDRAQEFLKSQASTKEN